MTATAAPTRRSAASAFGSMYGLVLRSITTRSRVLSMLALAALAVLVTFLVGRANAPELAGDPLLALQREAARVRNGTDLINEFGLWLLVPVPTLLFASASLGDPNDDRTLVYLWLRPVARTKIVLAAALASFTVAWPLVVPPLVLAAWLTRAGSDLVLGTFVAATLLVVAYTGLFVALGLRVRRPLAWGLLYIVIWEGFVARGSETASKLAMRAYGESILRSATGIDLLTSTIDPTWSLVVPPVVGAVALAYAVRRLRNQDIA